ncbi:MAG TPA: hypothetical protein V6D06_09985, partial [Trichocoleus sp.]
MAANAIERSFVSPAIGAVGSMLDIQWESLETGTRDDALMLSGDQIPYQIPFRPPPDASSTDYGAFRALILGDRSDDSITLTGRASAAGAGGSGTATSYGAFSSTVAGRQGSDVLTIISTAGGSGGRGTASGESYGLYQATAEGDEGDDTIEITASGAASGGRSLTG